MNSTNGTREDRVLNKQNVLDYYQNLFISNSLEVFGSFGMALIMACKKSDLAP